MSIAHSSPTPYFNAPFPHMLGDVLGLRPLKRRSEGTAKGVLSVSRMRCI